jgi:hypothetical protein
MPINDKQKIAVVDITPATQTLIESKLFQGYVIQHIVNLAPVYNKLLIIYALPEFI